MDQQSKPFISVVMPVYNGASTIGPALDSMLAQNYPQDRYEVIVVNDGSADDTAKVVAERQNVRYVELPRNIGKPSALNAGLEAATGEIFAHFDDDCQAAPDYLSQLALGYLRLDKPLGVSGLIMRRAPDKVAGLAAKYVEAIYVEAINSGNRSVDDTGPVFLPTIARRFYVYIKTNYTSRRNELKDEYPEVVELYGNNASFPIAKLRQIGGWDTSMAAPAVGGIEDRDVCFRLSQRFPDHHFYTARPARLILDQNPRDTAVSFKSYLLRPYRRGPFNYAFHVKNGLVPPLFPFPPLMLLILLAYIVVTALLMPPLIVLLPVLIVLLPQLCYGWWVKRAIVERRSIYLLFPYFQVAEETMVLAGLLRGYLLFGKMAGAKIVSEESSVGKAG
jgi:glycosyltransferase involved in cell wall biosynthesis